MKNQTIVNVVILGAIAIIAIISVQAYYINEAWSLKDKEFDQRVRIVLRKVAERIATYNESDLPSYNLIRRESSNYYIVNIDDDIDANALEHYLHSELTKASLNLDFEYAVFDCFSKDMVYGNYCSVNQSHSDSEKKALPKYDQFTYYFGVRFPTKVGYILQNTTRFWVAAALLALTVAFFAYAVFVILSQRRLSEMQKDFINNMTHEFKTPISSIKISSDVLSQDDYIKSSSRLKKYVSIINDQQSRLNQQVEKVLSLAKLEKDHFKLNKEDIELNETIEEVAETRRYEIEKRGGKLSLNLTDANTTISADPVHLTNILHNLLDNAIKYSSDKIDIELRTKVNDEEVVFEIEDNGIGIPKDHIRKLFKKFYRVPSGNVHNVKGFGLGLYYVYRMCKAHNWKLNLDSVLNKGTVCTIKLNHI